MRHPGAGRITLRFEVMESRTYGVAEIEAAPGATEMPLPVPSKVALQLVRRIEASLDQALPDKAPSRCRPSTAPAPGGTGHRRPCRKLG